MELCTLPTNLKHFKDAFICCFQFPAFGWSKAWLLLTPAMFNSELQAVSCQLQSLLHTCDQPCHKLFAYCELLIRFLTFFLYFPEDGGNKSLPNAGAVPVSRKTGHFIGTAVIT